MKKVILGVFVTIMLAAATVYASTQVKQKENCPCSTGQCGSSHGCTACTCSK